MKWIGLGLVALAVTAWGLEKTARLSARTNALRAMERLCRRVDGEIAYTAASPAQIMARLSRDTSLRELPFLAAFSAVAPADFCKKWQEELDAFCRCHGLNAEETSLCRDFGAALGTTDLNGQRTWCASCAEKLREAGQNAGRDYAENGRLYASLGALGGAAAVLILL